MQIQVHVSKEFLSLSPADKVVFTPKIVAAMTDAHATFPTPTPTLSDITTAGGVLGEKLLAYNTNPENHSALLEAEKEWNRLMSRLVNYVELTADGVGSIIDSSGFKQTKSETNPSVVPDVLVSDMYSGRTKGTAHIDNNTFHGAKAYINILSTEDVQVAQNGNQLTFTVGTSIINIILDTKRSADFTMLVSHKDMNGRSAALNTAGLGNLNGPVSVSIP